MQTFFIFFSAFPARIGTFRKKTFRRPRFPSLDFSLLLQPGKQNDAGQQSQNRPDQQYRPPAFALLRLNDDSALYDCRVTQNKPLYDRISA
jgi:hypothetical protein